MIDGTGREFEDELTNFLEWYLESGNKFFVPLEIKVLPFFEYNISKFKSSYPFFDLPWLNKS